MDATEGNPQGAAIRELPRETLAADARVDPFLRALALQGPATLIDNVHADLRLVDVSGTVVPVAVVEPAPRLADVVSPVARFAGYPQSELAKHGRPWTRFWAGAALHALGGVMRACAAERVVYVNNWMLATNPPPALGADQYPRLNAFLRARFPRHAIVHRTVNPYLDRGRHAALAAAGARMVCTRIVYLIDPRSERFRRSSEIQNDLRLSRRSPYRMIDAHAGNGGEPGRLAELYRLLYLDRHCQLNAAFNAQFFEQILRSPFFRTRILVHDGRVDAFGVSYTGDGCVTGALTGYDTRQPRSLGLYRLSMLDKILYARDHGLLLNISGGAGRFKHLRGAFPVREYDAVFDAHLPPWRRIPWQLAALEGRRWRAPAPVVEPSRDAPATHPGGDRAR